jgi:hypothetical protein
MSWRERIKGSFESIESIEYAGGDVESIKNNNKIKSLRVNNKNILTILKTPKTLKTPKKKNGEGGKPKNPEQIPAPSPANLGPEYDRLWNKAWELADWIDDPDGAPIAERRARLPELMQMRDRLAKIEKIDIKD